MWMLSDTALKYGGVKFRPLAMTPTIFYDSACNLISDVQYMYQCSESLLYLLPNLAPIGFIPDMWAIPDHVPRH